MKYSQNSSGYDYKKSFIGYAGIQADKKRKEVFEAANTEEIYEIKGTKYYISIDTPFCDIPNDLKSGDALLFERGGLWRTNGATISIPNGVILGAYGEGDKPKFYGSANNFADNSLWNKENDNIWVTNLPYGNVGIMVFNHEAALGVKKWEMEEVTDNYDYYYDYESKNLYFYYDGDLEADFDSIEIGTRGDIFSLDSNTVIDNICVKYTASHGIVVSTQRDNVKVTNCEVGFIGGSCQFKQVRFGNGIEVQLGGTNITIKNNWVYQCYDAGITFQSWRGANRETYYNNIDISENLIEFCYYGFEFFTTTIRESGLYSEYKNISISNNIFRFSGYAWSYEQRPDHWMNAHVRSSQRGWVEPIENFCFSENIFDCSRASIIFWWWKDTKGTLDFPEKMPGVSAKGNSFYQAPTPEKRCMTYAFEESALAENLEDLTKAVKRFDDNPKEIVWIDKIG